MSGPGRDLDLVGPLDEAPEAPDCPGHEPVWAAVAGELPPADVERLVRHSLHCPACQEAWRLAAEVHAAIAAPAASTSSEAGAADATSMARATAPTRPRHGAPVARGRRTRWYAAAAAAVLVVAIAGPLAWNARRESAAYRAADAARLQAVTPDGAEVAREGFVLRWSEPARGAIYAVEIATEKLDVIARVDALERPELRLDPGKLAAVPAGTTLLWRVDALLPDASRRSSPVYRVTLR